MILEQNKEKIQTYGDVQQNKVSIDPRNAEHIISILSSNLYSNPEESFLRETISNAVDSHKEAGTTDPIILLFKVNGSKYDIVVRDYGTGISPERFDEIYRYIGSSTKRDSNAYIGSFGKAIAEVKPLKKSGRLKLLIRGEGYIQKYNQPQRIGVEPTFVEYNTPKRQGLLEIG